MQHYDESVPNPHSNKIYTKPAEYNFELVKTRDVFLRPLTSPEESLSESEASEVESTECHTLDDFEVVPETHKSLIPRDEQKTETPVSRSPLATQHKEEEEYDADNESETTESENAASEHEETSYIWSGLSALAAAFRTWAFSSPQNKNN